MHTLAILLTLSAVTGQASDGKSSKGDRFGIGVQTTLRGLGPGRFDGLASEAGLSVVYDARKWRVATLLDLIFVDDAATAFAFGGRFLYAIHRRSRADFSIGAGTGFQFTEIEGGDSGFDFYFEGVGQIRVFLVQNVALNATLGLGFRVGEGPFAFGITGQANGSFGLTYFF